MMVLRRLACCLALIAGPASANESVEDFAGLWGNFLAFCGAVLTDPVNTPDNAQPIAGFSEFLLRSNPDRTDTYITHVATDRESSLTVHLTGKQSGFDLFCEATDYEIAFADPPSAATKIRAMFENGGMAVTGGPFQIAPKSTFSYKAELDALQEQSLVVEGAFPAHDVAVRLNISVEGVTMEIYTTVVGDG